MSVNKRKFIIQAVKPHIDVPAARDLVRRSIIQETKLNPAWVEEEELVGDIDAKGNVLERGGVWDFLDAIERLYSPNPVTPDEDDEGAETILVNYFPPNPYGLPVWEIVYAKYDSYTCNWIANCEYYNDEFPSLLSVIGISIWAGKHYDNPSILLT